MGRRPKKRLRERLDSDLTWAALSEKQQNDLLRLHEQGKYVSLIDEEPDIPDDCGSIYIAYTELRNSTPGDRPVGFLEKHLAWQTYGDIDFQMFVRFVSTLDSVFLRKHVEGMEKKRIESSRRRNAENAAKRAKSVNKGKVGSPKRR